MQFSSGLREKKHYRVGCNQYVTRQLDWCFQSRDMSGHATPLLCDLHWLNVPERIQFRLRVLDYRCVHGIAPSYLAETLHLTSSVESCRRRSFGSTSTLLLSTHDDLHLAIEHFQWSLHEPGMLCRRLPELLNRTLR